MNKKYNKSTPKISVLMPVYNAEKYLKDSVNSILNQTFTDFEFIIIDDCSTDKSLEILKNFANMDKRIRLFTNSDNLRICKTLNKGIDYANGKYIVRMDADDYSYPERLKIQYHFMESNPDFVVSGGYIEVCDENLKSIKERKYKLNNEDIRKNMFFFNPFAHPAVIYVTNAVKEIGYYNNDLADAEDYELYFRLGRIGKFGNVAKKLIKYRINQNQVSVRKSRRQELLTLYIRLKAYVEYGYSIKFSVIVYSILQLISVFIIPSHLKLKIYNLFRK